ncbi:CBM96 family carbohydrate-binding protein [Wenyingzhuangia sp. IMCC45467]
MKTLLKTSVLAISLLALNTNAQEKITVSADAFIQGGNTENTAFGTEKIKNLLILKSTGNDKYSRITYLKFKTPKKVSELKKVTLNFPIKVYENEEDPELLFNLDIIAVENDKWSESNITWSNALTLGNTVGHMKVPQTTNGKNNNWIEIELDAKEVSKLINGKKDKYITLALANNEFNRLSAILPSKENSPKLAAFLTVEY